MSRSVIPIRDVRWRCRGVQLRGLVGFLIAMPVAIWLAVEDHRILAVILYSLAGTSTGIAIGARLVDDGLKVSE